MERMAKLKQSAQPTVFSIEPGEKTHFGKHGTLVSHESRNQKTVNHCGVFSVFTQGLTTVKEEPLLDGTLIAEASPSPHVEICCKIYRLVK